VGKGARILIDALLILLPSASQLKKMVHELEAAHELRARQEAAVRKLQKAYRQWHFRYLYFKKKARARHRTAALVVIVRVLRRWRWRRRVQRKMAAAHLLRQFLLQCYQWPVTRTRTDAWMLSKRREFQRQTSSIVLTNDTLPTNGNATNDASVAPAITSLTSTNYDDTGGNKESRVAATLLGPSLLSGSGSTSTSSTARLAGTTLPSDIAEWQSPAPPPRATLVADVKAIFGPASNNVSGAVVRASPFATLPVAPISINSTSGHQHHGRSTNVTTTATGTATLTLPVRGGPDIAGMAIEMRTKVLWIQRTYRIHRIRRHAQIDILLLLWDKVVEEQKKIALEGIHGNNNTNNNKTVSSSLTSPRNRKAAPSSIGGGSPRSNSPNRRTRSPGAAADDDKRFTIRVDGIDEELDKLRALTELQEHASAQRRAAEAKAAAAELAHVSSPSKSRKSLTKGDDDTMKGSSIVTKRRGEREYLDALSLVKLERHFLMIDKRRLLNNHIRSYDLTLTDHLLTGCITHSTIGTHHVNRRLEIFRKQKKMYKQQLNRHIHDQTHGISSFFLY
jgi:hypothetical protein